MTRRSTSLFVATALGWSMVAGCDSGSRPAPAPAPGGVNYGPDKLPPADQVAPKRGRAPGSPGAPPARM